MSRSPKGDASKAIDKAFEEYVADRVVKKTIDRFPTGQQSLLMALLNDTFVRGVKCGADIANAADDAARAKGAP